MTRRAAEPPILDRPRVHPASPSPATHLDLSVLIPARDEGENLRILLPQLVEMLGRLGIGHEVLLLTHNADSLTREVAGQYGARIVEQRERGYGGALKAGFAFASGAYLLTMDADLSHPPEAIERLWAERENADVTIASRYVPGGQAHMGFYRYALSRVLNALFSRGLDVPIRDLSSGFRLYRTAVIREQHITSRDFDVLQQIVVQAFAEGWRVREVPFSYQPREHGSSHARVLRVGMACLRTFGQLWKLRNSILAADYDDRAHDSRIFLQRYWQRSRHRFVMELIEGQGAVLDVGCGSSRIIAGLPAGSVAVDVLHRKLRYARKFKKPLVRASGFALPFADASFECVLCSQVIEHVPKESPILDELCRVLRPGGRLVLGTPDYANWQWVYIEKLYGMVPGGYADEHIAHYTREELVRIMKQRGFALETYRYILQGELILAFRKAGRTTSGDQVVADLPVPPLEYRRLVGPTEPEHFDNPTRRRVFADLPPSVYASVFDFGCGCGRVARMLIQQDLPPLRYVGVDRHRGMIEWCRSNLSPRAPQFQFLHHNVLHPQLNPGGTPGHLPLPAEDGQVTLFIGWSIFTHLLEPDADFYIREMSRVLSPDGIAATTWFFFDKGDFPMMQEFQNALLINTDDPTNAVIFDRAWVVNRLSEAGLVVTSVVPPTIRGFQWVTYIQHKAPGRVPAVFPEDTAPRGLARPPT